MHDLVEQLPPGFTDTFQSRFVEVNDITLHTVIVGAVGPAASARHRSSYSPRNCRRRTGGRRPSLLRPSCHRSSGPAGRTAAAAGPVALTAFVPTDAAFRELVRDLTHAHRLPSEQAAFSAVAGLGVDTVENVLVYHVVPGATIDRRAAVKADGAELTTALGAPSR